MKKPLLSRVTVPTSYRPAIPKRGANAITGERDLQAQAGDRLENAIIDIQAHIHKGAASMASYGTR